VTNSFWEFIMGFAFQPPACSSFANPTPLLEEKRNPAVAALIPQRQNPLFFHWPRASAALPTNDHPIDKSQVHLT
jgi:hypothetical protein